MRKPFGSRILKWIAILGVGVLCVLAFLFAGSAGSPPSVSMKLLGYTNRVGPHALLALTNHSSAAVTLHPTCLVKYSASEDGTRGHVTSVEVNTFVVTQLLPNEGFVQEVFVFPSGNKAEWQVEYSAAYSSRWLEARRIAESWLQRRFRSVGYPFTSGAWATINTEWEYCPP